MTYAFPGVYIFILELTAAICVDSCIWVTAGGGDQGKAIIIARHVTYSVMQRVSCIQRATAMSFTPGTAKEEGMGVSSVLYIYIFFVLVCAKFLSTV